MPAPLHRPLRTLAAACALLAAGPVLAQSSPYYIGVAQSITHDSNLYRIGGGRGLPVGAQSKSDTVSTTSLVAGVDQTWGRQRLSGNGSLQASRFASNDQLNNEGYGLALGLDWETVNRLSGRLGLNADRSLRSFDPAVLGGQRAERNIEDNNLLSAVVRLGVVTRLTAEATLSHRQVRFSNARYAASEYDQDTGSLGLRYRLGGATTVGLAWRQSKVDYQSIDDPYKRRDIDFTATWVPSGLTTLNARISHTSTDHARSAQRDFSGVTAELRGSTQATGKIRLNARLSRDLGQSSSFIDLLPLNRDFSRTTTGLRLGADYELSAKIALNASIDHQRRSFTGAVDLFGQPIDGSDRTTRLALGARWVPTRAIQVGCDLTHETRSVQRVGNAYDASGFGCSGQFVFQ
ncbi:MAG TPA: outer membrane beta-barrel protein [Aquabacterium sp.]|nr:outer membrane beta-barrel protein [Aquabacterium sp.]HQC98665.1 outer membrane beta-barrel protein [Aquabacterium sp.]